MRVPPAVLTYATRAATKSRATFTSACDAVTSTVRTPPVFARRIPLILQPGDAAHVAQKDVSGAAATMKGYVAATARGTVSAAERKASVAGAAEAAGASLDEATPGPRKQDLAVSGGGEGSGTSSAAGLVTAAVTVASAGFKTAFSSGVSAGARFASGAGPESAAARTVKSPFAPGEIEAAVVPIYACSGPRSQHTAFTLKRAEKCTSRPTSMFSENSVSSLQGSLSTQSIEEIGGTSQALRCLPGYRPRISSLEMPFHRAAIASYSVAVAATSGTATRTKLSILTSSPTNLSFHAAAYALAHASAAADDKLAAAPSVALIPFALETSLAIAATNPTALFSPHCTSAAATSTTTPRLPTAAASALSSLPTAFPAGAAFLSRSRGNLSKSAAAAFSPLSLTASGRTAAAAVRADACCSFSFSSLQAPASPNYPSAATAAFFSAASPLPAGNVSPSFPVAEFNLAAAQLNQSPVTAYNLTAGVIVVRTACLFDVTTCNNILHKAATCSSNERDIAGSRTVEEHSIFVYPSYEDTYETPTFSPANSIGGNRISGHTQVEKGDTHRYSERKRPKRLLLDPHLQQAVKKQLQQHTQHHSCRNIDHNEQVHHCAVQQLTQQHIMQTSRQEHLMQKARQDHVHGQEQRDIRDGVQQRQEGTIMLDTMASSADDTARCCGSFAEADGFCSTRSSNAPLESARCIDLPDCVVPMLLRWRPKKSFKKKTMNLPSTKARRRWARLRR